MNISFPIAIIGSQWGDEGKGKIVDLLANKADYVVRFNGGNNAGHTVVVNHEKYKLSLLPSGVMQKKKLFLSQGVVIDPKVLLEEIEFFEKRGITVDLMIDKRVHIVMPYHKALDSATESWKGKSATGSLHLGIGYCYEDKNNRFGIRFEDLINPKSFKEKLKMFFPLKKRQIELVFGQKFEITEDEIFKSYSVYGKKLKKYLGDISTVVQKSLSSPTSLAQRVSLGTKRTNVLFEGAHGTFLDGVFGTYPYTTAVYTISGAVFPYVGIAPQKIYTLGVVKAYTTRVGNGPFFTELFDKIGEFLRNKGGEFGTVSKRPRRCGWLDIPMLKEAVRLSGFDYLAITKLDVLSGLKEIKICINHVIARTPILHRRTKQSQIKRSLHSVRDDRQILNEFTEYKPVYKVFKGWAKDISKIKKFKDLPKEAQIYLKFIEKELKVPIKIISVGAEREANIINQ